MPPSLIFASRNFSMAQQRAPRSSMRLCATCSFRRLFAPGLYGAGGGVATTTGRHENFLAAGSRTTVSRRGFSSSSCPSAGSKVLSPCERSSCNTSSCSGRIILQPVDHVGGARRSLVALGSSSRSPSRLPNLSNMTSHLFLPTILPLHSQRRYRRERGGRMSSKLRQIYRKARNLAREKGEDTLFEKKVKTPASRHMLLRAAPDVEEMKSTNPDGTTTLRTFHIPGIPKKNKTKM
ncbi:unnamed protein product [Amoebophrya sp. A120]|nr:unnamed protein product [Amoebophrya sp. A120]|eukprot:GSA120T00022922001.1